VEPGDYIVRGDQPFRTIADMYFSIQNYPPQNPTPYDDTGWTFQLMRDIRVVPVTDRRILDQSMTGLTEDVRAGGGVAGTGRVLVVEHTADNNLVTFRFRNAGVRMLAAEEDFTLADRRLRAGAVIVPDGEVSKLEPQLKELGLSAWAVGAVPQVKTHELDVPRIGYVHSWTRTQDEGWWRAALDTYGIPYAYFADQKLRDGDLREKYDVILFPHIGGTAVAQVNGMAKTGASPLPYKKTETTPNLAVLDSSEDIRGGMGIEGLAELAKFVRQGGLLVTEGSTATIFPAYGIASGVTVEEPAQLFARGSVLRSRIVDAASPIVYGYAGSELPVYFNQAPVLSAGGRGDAPPQVSGGSFGQNITPNAVPLRISPFDPAVSESADRLSANAPRAEDRPRADDVERLRPPAGAGEARPRVVLQFAADVNELLLSGSLANGQLLAGRAAAIDERVGDGHIVMFAIRPFWRWQTQGTFGLGFNAILNWNDLDAGK
jgi:hypothetical protein